ncbi:hypothetical protein [Candidatus Scalindua japonica]|uniref:hypothetical protein n=1 Tax=Candidatus Scalindua japonica TaxID=1284222 RepID=UPI000BDEDD88|nr:hypothetical protein [Candidatus Scalindua japonica]
MKQIIIVILLAILLSAACNSSNSINISKILQDNRQAEELEAQFFDVSKKTNRGLLCRALNTV